ncbi:MAG: D-glycero-alpha-D-manno-heptose-1,7-bisphosphate 7-phosphatase [Gemmatimonadales bacterium]
MSHGGRAAVFLDRDGTIIEDVGYLADPERVRLLPGAAEAIGRLNRAGLLAVVVTNQSGIARGLLDEVAYQATRERLDYLLAERGAHLDGQYHCPHHPELSGPCQCRKPGLLLYRQAGEELGIDLAASWWVGDRLRDVQPARSFGGRGVVLGPGAGAAFSAAPDLAAAVTGILASR